MKHPTTPILASRPGLLETARALAVQGAKAVTEDRLVVMGAMVLLAFAALQALRQIYSSDLGFHLATGRWILQHAAFPRVDTFTSTVAGADWVDLYWLYQLGQTLLDRLGGDTLLVLANGVMILISLLLVIARTALRSAGALRFLLPMLLAAIAGMTFELRPHVYSWVFLNLLLLLLESYAHQKHRGLVLLPLIMVVWMNTHPVAALGWVVMGCYLLGGWIRDRRLDSTLALWSGLAVLASLVTPYGVAGAALPFQQLGFLQEENVFKRLIGEYRSMLTLEEYRQGGRVFFLQSLFPLHLTLALMAVGILLSIRRLSSTEWLLLLAFGYVGSLAMKNFEYLVLAVAPIAAAGYAAAAEPTAENRAPRKPKRRNRSSSRLPRQLMLWSRRVGIAVIALAGVLSVLTLTNGYYVALRAPFRFGFGTDEHSLPIRATRFLHDNGLQGRLLNDITSGGYLIDKLALPVFVDGRNEVFREEFARRYLSALTGRGFAQLLDRYQPQIAVFTHAKLPQWIELFSRREDWRLVYADDLSVIYLRQDYATEIPALIVPTLEPGTPLLGESSVENLLGRRWQAGPLWVASALISSQYSPDAELRFGVLLYQLGLLEPAARVGLRGLEKSTIEPVNLFFNLGGVFFDLGKLQWSERCYRRVLEHGPDLAAEQRLRQLERMPLEQPSPSPP
jgi:hypothetical protein